MRRLPLSAMLQMRVNDFRRLVKGLGVRQLKAGKTVFVLSKDLRTALFPNPTPVPVRVKNNSPRRHGDTEKT